MTRIFIATILLLLFVSCNNKGASEEPKPDVPKAMEDESSSFEFISKRGYDDLIESLYKELLSKDTNLNQLEKQIVQLRESEADTIKLFNSFNGKNQSYFASANNHASQIHDTILRDKMKALVGNSLAKYNTFVVKHTGLLKLIETNDVTISDLHNALKILRTLPIIENYQRSNLPAIKSLDRYIKRQNRTIRLADTLTKN